MGVTVSELAEGMTRLFAMATDNGIMMGVILGRDVCVSNQGPFEVDLVGEGELPRFHGTQPYVRYQITRQIYAENGGLKR